MAEIRIDRVRKVYDRKVEALKGVSLEVKDGEFSVLLGPSGCGKTTLLRCVAGLEEVDGGRIFIGGDDVTSLPPRRRGVAMVFQNYAVFPHLSVFENIAFGLRTRGVEAKLIRERVGEVARLLRIEELLDRYPHQLSGGQNQRVAVARALAVHPKVLLMDEPLSNLDALLRLQMRAELKGLLSQIGTTTLYVTHDQVEAMSLGDRIAVMKEGEILQYDTPMEVYENPADTFVGGFIGNPPMNFLRGEMVAEGGGLWFRAKGVRFPLPKAPSGLKGREVVMGIRAEHITISLGEGEAKVMVVEPLGSHNLLTLDLAGEPLKVVLPPEVRPDIGQRVSISFNPDKGRFFDPHTGKRLTG